MKHFLRAFSPSFVVACVLGAGRIIASGGRDPNAWQDAAALIGFAAAPGVDANRNGIPDHMERDAGGVVLPDDAGYRPSDVRRRRASTANDE